MTLRLLFLASVAVVSLGCGFTTHDTIATRAVNYFFTPSAYGDKYTRLLAANGDAIQGGAPFPDYLYTCPIPGGNSSTHNLGEYAHWAPFQANAAQYITSLPKPWDNNTEALVAFFHGVTSHYIADINWHGLLTVPSGYGFIETLGIADFNCSGDLCSVAHSAADTGGEFVAAWQMNLTGLHPSQWYIPTTDLINIYSIANLTVLSWWIDECALIFYVGETAVKYLGFIVWTLETDNAPFLVEHYLDHPLGGVDDMAVFTQLMWNRLENWFENGAPPGPPPLHEGSHWPGFTHNRTAEYMAMVRALGTATVHTGMYESTPAGHGTILKAKPGVTPEDVLEATLKALVTSSEVKEAAAGMFGGAGVETLLAALGRVGEIVTEASSSSTNASTLKQDGAPDVLGAWAGNVTVGYFGSSLSTGDYNGDGMPDIAIGQYGASPQTLPQVGSVSIQLGPVKPSGGPLSLPGITLQPSSPADVFGRFGWALATLDFNMDGIDDLAISSPTRGWNWSTIDIATYTPDYLYYGRVDVYFGSSTPSTGNPFKATPDVTIDAVDLLTNFGTVLSIGDVNSDGSPDLIVGNPYARGDPSLGTNAVQRGSVVVFYSSTKWKSGTTTTDATADVTLYGQDQFAWFGSSIAVVQYRGQPTLLVGAPGYRSNGGTTTVGRLSGYTVASLTNPAPSPVFTITGSSQQGKFAHSFATNPISASHGVTLAVSVPTSSDVTGLVAIFPLDNIPSGDTLFNTLANVSPAYTLLQASKPGSRFGWALSYSDVSGDGSSDLIVSSPFESISLGLSPSQRNSGAVYVYTKPFVNGTITSAETLATWSVTGSSQNGRAGYNMLPVNITTSPSDRFSLALPEPFADAPDGTTQGGRITLYSSA